MGGVRGTVALEDIEVHLSKVLITVATHLSYLPSIAQTGEHMLCIPYSLMISPPLCRSFPPLREVFETIEMFRTNDDLVRDACLLVLHVLHVASCCVAAGHRVIHHA